MRRNALATLTMLGIIALLPGSWAKGQYDEYSDPQARLAGLESMEDGPGYAEASAGPVSNSPRSQNRPAVYKMTDPATMTSYSDNGACTTCDTGGGGCQPSCCSNSCSTGCSSGCCKSGCCGAGGLGAGGAPLGGFVGGAEFVFLRPFASNGDLPNANFGVAGGIGQTDRTLNYNYQVTPRVFFGYVGANGLGGRVRYWQYDHAGGTNTATDPITGNVATIAGGLKFQTFDLEMTQQSQFRNWNLLLAGGVRYASFAMDSGNSIVDALAVPVGYDNRHHSVSGTGLTAALQARRSLNASGTFVLLTNLRGSILFGNHRSSFDMNNQFGPNAASTKNRDDLFSIWEWNLGPQWSLPLANGGRFFIGGTVEAQVWQGVGTYSYNATNSNGLGLGNLGLLGFGGNIGLTR
jgi:hypothetical protein